MNKKIRIRFAEKHLANLHYITVDNKGDVRCYTGKDIPQSLSNVVQKGNTPELRFQLEDIGLMIGSSTLGEFEKWQDKALRIVKTFCPEYKDYQIL